MRMSRGGAHNQTLKRQSHENERGGAHNQTLKEQSHENEPGRGGSRSNFKGTVS